jgi:hypothetical protein
VYTGLRPGEKLHEELFGPGEHDIRSVHPLISHVDVPALDPTQVRILDPYAHPTDLVAELVRLYRPRPQPLTAPTAQVPYTTLAEPMPLVQQQEMHSA